MVTQLSTWRSRHALGMVWVTLAITALIVSSSPVPLWLQVVILGLGVAVFGIPHGALDHRVGKTILKSRFGQRWAALFFSSYVGFACAVLGAWQLAPLITLALFLLASAFHFGLGDVERELSVSRLYWAEVWARGAMPLIITGFCFPEDVATFFAWLIPSETQPFILGLVGSIGRPLMAVLIATLGPFFLFHILQAPYSSRHALVVGELITLGGLFSFAPPLLSFVVYFCGWHSVRHTLALAYMLSPENPQQGIVRFAQQALPLTLVTIGVAFAAWLFVQTSNGMTPATVRIVFLTLSALTFPHMLLVALAGNRIGVNYDV